MAVLALTVLPLFPEADAQGETVFLVNVDGTITPTTTELVAEAIDAANREGAGALVLLLNTPGGSVQATFDIISTIERSPVPVVGFVFPRGATAWSAGTYILISTHIAAMAPGTVIGSGQPVAFSPFGGSQPINDTKIINALTAYLVERAREHGRNETAARAFVTENLNLNAEEALSARVIEVKASSVEELLEKIHGVKVTTTAGEVILNTRGAQAVEWSPSFRIYILKPLSEPLLAFLLLFVGIYALILGLTSPGAGGEVVGAALIILGLIGLGITGANIGALVLIGLGAVLLLYELFTPGFGIIGGAGFVMTVIGGILLFQGPLIVAPETLRTLFLTVIAVPTLVGGFFLLAAYKVVKVRRRRPFLGGIVSGEAVALDDIAPGKAGFVRYQGEYWKAESEVTIHAGQTVIITGKEGPTLKVKLKEEKQYKR